MKSCCLLMEKEDFPVNPSREGFKLRVNNKLANSSFCASTSAYISKNIQRGVQSAF